jgi:hypothetical protein
MRQHKDDILIGDDKWIEFISLEGRYDQAVEVDQYLNGLWPLIEKLETHCVAGCCGFDAFDFTQDGIYQALDNLNCHQLLEACTVAQNLIWSVESTVIVSTRMNNLADRHVFMQLLEHVENCIKKYCTQHEDM